MEEVSDVTSQSDSVHRAAGRMGIGDQDAAGLHDEQDLDPETARADAHHELADAQPEPVVAKATEVDQEADPARRSPGAEWHDIQAMFVDDPRRSVQFAAEKADAAVSALAELLQRRRSALATAAAGAPNAPRETEELREMLRSYRIFCQSISDLGGQLRNAAAPAQ